MIELTAKELLKWKETFAKDGISYDTDDEYKESVNNLVGYFDTYKFGLLNNGGRKPCTTSSTW